MNSSKLLESQKKQLVELNTPFLDSQFSGRTQSPYEPLLFPPNIEKAKLHGRAARVARSLDSEKQMICHCCDKNAINHTLPLWCNLRNLYPFRYGTPLFFQMTLFSIASLTFLFVSFGAVSIYFNQLVQPQGIERYSRSFINQFTILEVVLDPNRSESLFVEMILLPVGLICFFIAFQQFRDKQKDMARACAREAISPSEFAISLVGLTGSDVTEEDIRNFFLVNTDVKDHHSIKKIVFAYNIGELTQLHRNKLVLVNKIHKLTEAEKENMKKDNGPLAEARLNSGTKSKRELEIFNIGLALKNTEEKIAELEDRYHNEPTSLKFAGTAIVIFNTEADAKIVKKKWNMMWYKWLFIRICSYIGMFNSFKLKGYLVSIRSTPEPVDILWENIGYTWKWRIFNSIKRNFWTALVLLLTGPTLFLIYYLQSTAVENKTIQIILPFLASLFIIITNDILIAITRKAALENQSSYTEFHQSFARKMIFAQFINTAITPIYVHIVLFILFSDQQAKTQPIQNQILDGLTYNMIFVFLSNAFLTPLLHIFNPLHIFRLWKQSRIEINPRRGFLTQAEANALFEGPAFNISSKYASLIKTMWLTGLYATLMPICIPVSLIGISLKYWTDKYLLLRRNSAPQLTGRSLPKNMMIYLEMFSFWLALGSFIINFFVAADSATVTFCRFVSAVLLIVSLLRFFIPVRTIYKKLARSKSAATLDLKYDDVKLSFMTDYDRANPVTKSNAEENYIVDFMQSMNEQNILRNLSTSQSQIKVQPSPSTNVFVDLATYVLEQPDIEGASKHVGSGQQSRSKLLSSYAGNKDMMKKLNMTALPANSDDQPQSELQSQQRKHQLESIDYRPSISPPEGRNSGYTLGDFDNKIDVLPSYESPNMMQQQPSYNKGAGEL